MVRGRRLQRGHGQQRAGGAAEAAAPALGPRLGGHQDAGHGWPGAAPQDPRGRPRDHCHHHDRLRFGRNGGANGQTPGPGQGSRPPSHRFSGSSFGWKMLRERARVTDRGTSVTTAAPCACANGRLKEQFVWADGPTQGDPPGTPRRYPRLVDWPAGEDGQDPSQHCDSFQPTPPPSTPLPAPHPPRVTIPF